MVRVGELADLLPGLILQIAAQPLALERSTPQGKGCVACVACAAFAAFAPDLSQSGFDQCSQGRAFAGGDLLAFASSVSAISMVDFIGVPISVLQGTSLSVAA